MTGPNQDYTIFFVCGHPRSGTNWIRNLLNLHPKVICDGESPFARFREIMDASAQQYWSLGRRPSYHAAMEHGFSEMVRACTMTLLEEKPGAVCVGDHTPRLLWPYVPDSRLIHITRDGRDVLVSWTMHQLATGFPVGEPYTTLMAAQREAFATDPFHFTKHPHELLSCEGWVRAMTHNWACFMQWDRDTRARIEGGELAGHVHEVRYEALHADVEGHRREMYRFLGVDPEEASPVGWETCTNPGRDGEDPTSNLRSAKVGEWKKYFTDDVKRWFKEAGGSTLVEFGYEQDGNW